MTNLDSVLQNRDIALLTEVHLVKAMVFLVVIYRCDSWTIKKKKKKKKDRHTIDILVPKGRNWKGEKGDRSQKIQIKLSKANYI